MAPGLEEGIPLNVARGSCCRCYSLKRTDEPDKSQTPGNGYDGDLVAPMIRDVGLALAMGDTVVDVMAAQMGKAGSNQNGGHDGAGGRDLHIGAWHVAYFLLQRHFLLPVQP